VVRPDEAADVQSFYSLAGADLSQAICQGTACFAARHARLPEWQGAAAQIPRVYCLGKCYAAPAMAADLSRPRIEVKSRSAVVLERIAAGGAHTLDTYVGGGGLAGLKHAMAIGPEATIAQIQGSGLRGHGGAGFPTGIKWRAAAAAAAPTKHVVANLDEGDPGAYIDRFIAQDDPFALVEGMAIAAYAVGAAWGYLYVRCEYPDAIARLQQALNEARSSRLLGPCVLDTDFSFDIELIVGAGSYECGEETSLLNSIEGRRPVARVRPPYVAECGLWGLPTIVNNAETLACVPWILRHGADAYAILGIPDSRGTKVLSLNSLFRRPGLYEVEFGISLREIVDKLGGGLSRGNLLGLMVGGPLAGMVPPHLLDTRLGFAEMRAIGASVGHGGVIAFDDRTTIPELIEHVFAFGANESCGQCTPCRLGTRRIEEIFAGVLRGAAAAAEGRESEAIVTALKLASLCGLGTGLGEFAESIIRHYSQELRACFA
jgi:NADH:ubiquinone oxidoreductase subunit F (NADH-binding)